LKQGQYQPISVAGQVALVWTGTSGNLDDIPVAKISEFEKRFLSYMDSRHRKVLAAIVKEKVITPEIEKSLEAAVKEFKKAFKV
jgi:F-type H+-transporting ATPase subunit alpha